MATIPISKTTLSRIIKYLSDAALLYDQQRGLRYSSRAWCIRQLFKPQKETTMTKHEIIDAIIDSTGITRSQALHAFDATFKALADGVASGNDIFIRGFGTFRCSTLAARKGRNIKAGTTIDIPARKTIKFKPCPALKLQINK